MTTRTLYLILLVLVLSVPARALDASRDSLLQALRLTDIPSEKILILNQLAGIYTEEDPVRAGNYASQALLRAESIQDLTGMAEAYYHLGELAQMSENHKEAMEYLLMAEEIFREEKDAMWLARLNLLISKEYRRKMEYDKAIGLLYQAMETFEQSNDLKKIGETYNAIGGNFYDQDNYEKAFEYFTRALAIFEELGETSWIGRLYNNIAEIYRLNGDYAKAIAFFNESRTILFRFNDPAVMTVIYSNLGYTFLNMGQLDSAGYYLEMGKKLADISDDEARMAFVNITLGRLDMALGKREDAIDHVSLGYQQALRTSSYANIVSGARLLSDLYSEKGDYKQAYRYFIKYRDIDDSLHQVSNLAKITQMEMNLLYDLDKEAREIQVQRVNLKYFTIAFILISVILVIVLLYGRQRIRMAQDRILREKLKVEKVRLKEEIDNKNRELTTNVMFLVKKNELINYISERLLKAKSEFKPSIRKAVDEILMDLQSNLDENIWQVFEDRFKEVHKEFYNNLIGQFPNLSDNDRKLCAFIRLNMNTKEIAAITHQNPNSIEVARTRLRKKLNISNTDVSLNNFLANI